MSSERSWSSSWRSCSTPFCPHTIGSLSITTVKTVIALVLIIAAVLWAGLRILRWRFATYHLTDKRIVMEGGILSRTAETIPLDRIQNTVIHRPLGDRLIGAGDIEIEFAGRDGVEVLHRIPKAEAVLQRDARHHERAAAAPAPQRVPAVSERRARLRRRRRRGSTGEGGDRSRASRGCRLDPSSDDLAVGEDRSDGVAVRLEQSRDAQMLEPPSSGREASLIAFSVASLGTARTDRDRPGTGNGALANTIACRCFDF